MTKPKVVNTARSFQISNIVFNNKIKTEDNNSIRYLNSNEHIRQDTELSINIAGSNINNFTNIDFTTSKNFANNNFAASNNFTSNNFTNSDFINNDITSNDFANNNFTKLQNFNTKSDFNAKLNTITRTVFVFLIALFLTANTDVFARTITVTNSNDAGSGSLRDAINNAKAGNRIEFAPNVNSVILTSGEILITQDLTICGKKETANVIISGNKNSRIFSLLVGTLNISNLTLANGKANDGGAVYVLNNSNLFAANCIFESNFADNHDKSANGGAVEVVNGTFSADNCIFNDNHAISNAGSANGGAVNVVRGHFTAKNCIFSNNSAISNASSAGGGAVNVRSNTEFIAINTIFIHNSATVGNDDIAGGFGGAIRVAFNGNGYLFHCTLDENQATTSGGGMQTGGKLYSYNCIYTKNAAHMNSQIAGKISNAGDWNLIEGVNDVTRGNIFGNNQYITNKKISHIKPLPFARSAKKLSIIDIPITEHINMPTDIINAIARDKLGQMRHKHEFVSYGAIESPAFFDLTVNKSLGGSTDITTKQLAAGSEVTVRAIPAKGYKFKHWECSDTSAIVSKSSVYAFTINSDTSLRAVFARARS